MTFLMKSRTILECYHPNIRLLGAGYESCVFTDDSRVYKIFRQDCAYYEFIGKQISGRFKGCKHLYDVGYEILDGYTVFTYDYEPSRSYSGGMKEEIIELMVEFASCGVACTDVKPNNIRVTSSGLKYIDYGHNLIPFTESDFVTMCLRSFLCLKYWPDPQFVPLAQITNYTWNRERTKGFIDFFNKIYSRYLERIQSAYPPEYLTPSNRWIDRMISEYADEKTEIRCISDLSGELFMHPVSQIEDIVGSSDLFLITDYLRIPKSLTETVKRILRKDKNVRLIAPNPFFNGGFTDYRRNLESDGLFPIILSHSDPIPCKGGLKSKYALIELKNHPVDNNPISSSRRNEDYIFVICGRNVTPECYMRCWNSVEKLRCGRWGAVIVDDASDNEEIDLLIRSTACRHKRVTYIRNKERRSILPNIVHSIKYICTNPNSVIITLDMDDALLNKDALCIIHAKYLRGHDMVSSTCLKKGVRILPYEIRYGEVRNEKMGDIWMHLRSFRKYLFDRINESNFKEDGRWIEIFNELTFMVPMAEMASNPIQIKAPLYLWEPRTVDDDDHKAADLHTKSLIRSRKPYKRYDVPRILGDIRPPGMLVNDFNKSDILIIRHAEKEDRPDYLSTERGITERGERESKLFGSCLKHIDLYICSEIRRTAETAYCMNKGNGGEFNILIDPDLNALRYDYSIWCRIKEEFGFLGALHKWRNGELINDELPDFKRYSIKFLEKLLDLSRGKTICVITHDHLICALSTIFGECLDSRVPYMGGFALKRSDISSELEKIRSPE